ncbi:MAG: hypothetical protein MJ201_05695 [Mycoplasmoidaceae bacterium]|nr:hypothetical protein [Mycoplasmoidaceae bacterium]
MITAFTHASLSCLAIQLVLGYFDPALATSNAAKKPVQDGIQEAKKTSLNLYQRTVQMFKSLYQGTKNFFKSIKNYIQAKKLDQLIVKGMDEEELVEYIRKQVSLLVKGSEEYLKEPKESLFTLHFEDLHTLEGTFANGEDFLKKLDEILPCVNKNSLLKNLSTEEKLALGNRDKLAAIYQYCRDNEVFGVFERELSSFENIDDLREYFATQINK